MAFNNVLNSLFGRDEDDEAYDMNDIIIRNTSIEVKMELYNIYYLNLTKRLNQVAENMTIFIRLLNLSN